jgi:cobalt/nickel transport protein
MARKATSGRSRKAFAVLAFLLMVSFGLIPLTFCNSAFGADKWPGVDESVVEKFASERGREAHSPLINTDQGDLLLFVFLLAGVIGGFAGGYSWRMLVEGKSKSTASAEKKQR